jgi:excisionase family DNA binding protein
MSISAMIDKLALEMRGEKPMERSKSSGVNGIMDISEAADYLHIKKWTLYRLVKRGKIPGIKVGGQWRFKKEVLDEMFTQGSPSPAD